MQASNTVDTLERLADDAYKAFEVTSRPSGDKWLYMVLYLAQLILDEKGLLDAITQDDLDKLADANYHTARHAAEVLLQLNKYK